MKKAIILLFSIIILFSSCNSSNNTDNSGNINVNCKYDFFDFAVAPNDNIYICDKEEIQVLDSNGKNISTINNSVKFCRNIAFDKEMLYVYDEASNTIKTFDLNGKLIKEYFIEKVDCVKMECVDGKIFMLQYDKNDNFKGSIIIYDMKNDKNERQDFDNIQTFTLYKDNKLIIGTYSELYIYDYVTKQKINEYKLNPIISELTYDPTEDMIYTITNNMVNRLKLTDGSKETVYQSNSNESLYKLKVLKNSCLLMDKKNNAIYEVSKKMQNDDNSKVVTILTSSESMENNPQLKRTEDILKKVNTDLQIKYNFIPASQYSAILKTRLMGGDRDFDIFYINNFFVDELVNSGGVLDLSIYPSFIEKFYDLFSGVKSLCESNGRLCGVPYFFAPIGWQVNDQLLDKLNIPCPEFNWTWKDFYIIAKSARQDLDGDGKKDTYALKVTNRKSIPFLQQYNTKALNLTTNKVSYNNNEFIGLLELWKRLSDEDLILFTYNQIMNKSDNVLFNESLITIASGKQHFISPPFLENERVYAHNVDILSVNTNSKNIELAVEFLTTYLSKDVQVSVPALGLYKDIKAYDVQSIPFNKIELIDERGYAVLEHLLCYSKRAPYIADLGKFINDTIETFMNGSITAEQAARLIDEKAKMVVGE